MGHRIAASWALVFSCPLVLGCDRFPNEAERFDEGVVATVYDHQADFRSYATFSIVSSVTTAEIADNGVTTTGTLDQEAASAVIAKVTALMQMRGYGLVEATQSPDLGIGIAAVKGTGSTSVSGGYWGDYYGGYWGYPGAGYYYPYAYTYTYDTGTLVIDIVDLRRARTLPVDTQMLDAGAERYRLAVVWGAVAYKALPAQTVGPADVSTAIEQAFLQSPYLQR